MSDFNPAPPSALAPDANPRKASAGILVVDDHDLLRLGFRALVQSQIGTSGMAITVFEASSLVDAIGLYEASRNTIDVVVLDLDLPDRQGLSGLADFRARFPEAPVVVLSGASSGAIIRGALALGARAFLRKSGDLSAVVRFVRVCVLQGPDAACRELALADADATTDGSALATRAQPLTTRQSQILQWVLEGKSNREIAQLAFLSEGTVKNHVSTLLLLFGVHSRAQLISTLRT